jgi:hypothetical protein
MDKCYWIVYPPKVEPSLLLYIILIHRVIHSLWTVGNAVGRVGKRDPRVLSLTAG